MLEVEFCLMLFIKCFSFNMFHILFYDVSYVIKKWSLGIYKHQLTDSHLAFAPNKMWAVENLHGCREG